jgi:hypothetical protein
MTPSSTGKPVPPAAGTASTASPSRGPVFDAARQYIERGYPVVLLHGVQDGACTCLRGAQCQSAGKHPVANAWQEHAARTVEVLQECWDNRFGTRTNIGVLVADEDRVLLIDVDVKGDKQGDQTLKDWGHELGIDFEQYLTQVTPSGGRHYAFRIPEEVDSPSLPNRTNVARGIDVLRNGRQFVVAPSTVGGGRRYHRLGDDTPVVLPPIDQLPEAPLPLIEHLRSLGGDRTRTREPVTDVESLRAPSVEKVREVVSYIPNNEDVDRGKYIWMAYRIVAACGRGNEPDARDIFLEWASHYPGADADKDARVFDTLDWAKVHGGWADLWHFASRHGYDATDERRCEAQEEFETDCEPEPGEQKREAGRAGGQNQPAAVRLFNAILRNPEIEVFADRRRKRPYVRLRHRGTWHTHSLDSETGVALLRYKVSQGKRPPGTQTFNDTMQLLRGHARFEVPPRDVYLRVAHLGDTIYIDVGDATFQAVEIRPTGWRIIDEPPVLFVRSDAMQPLPAPVAGGSLDDFRAFFQTSSDDDLRLLVTFLADTYAAPERAPRPILSLDGPPGSAKTTMTRFAKDLTDPQVGGLFAPPQTERDLVIAAASTHVVALDNASTIKLAMSDALCRLTTGGALRTRKLYSDEGEVIFDELRHVMLNAVGDAVRQNDLRDRCLFISARRVAEPRPDNELRQAFEAVNCRLFGVLLNAVASVLANEPSIEIDAAELPRMAGFAKRGAACAEVLGWSADGFLVAYRANIERAAMDYLDDDLVAHAVCSQSWQGARAWLRGRLSEQGVSPERIAAATAEERWGDDVVWRGSATDLLAYLEERVGSETTRKRAWPGTVQWFGRLLKMAEAAVRQAGWAVEYPRNGREGRVVIIRRIGGWDGDRPDLDVTSRPSLEGIL